MSITYTLNNQSSESAESISIKPLRTGWTTREMDSGANRSIVEYRQAGDDIMNPLVCRIIRTDKNVFHAAHGPEHAVPGVDYTVHFSTDITVEDSVAGQLPYIPVNFQFKLQFGGAYLPDAADVLDLALTAVSTLWGSVSTGTPDSGNINKLAAGGIDLL